MLTTVTRKKKGGSYHRKEKKDSKTSTTAPSAPRTSTKVVKEIHLNYARSSMHRASRLPVPAWKTSTSRAQCFVKECVKKSTGIVQCRGLKMEPRGEVWVSPTRLGPLTQELQSIAFDVPSPAVPTLLRGKHVGRTGMGKQALGVRSTEQLTLHSTHSCQKKDAAAATLTTAPKNAQLTGLEEAESDPSGRRTGPRVHEGVCLVLGCDRFSRKEAKETDEFGPAGTRCRLHLR